MFDILFSPITINKTVVKNRIAYLRWASSIPTTVS